MNQVEIHQSGSLFIHRLWNLSVAKITFIRVKYCVINNCQTVNRDNPCGTTDPTTHGLTIISDNLLIETRYITLLPLYGSDIMYFEQIISTTSIFEATRSLDVFSPTLATASESDTPLIFSGVLASLVVMQDSQKY